MSERKRENIQHMNNRNPTLYITPIAKKDGKYKSNMDYNLQMANMYNGESAYWYGPDPIKYKAKVKVNDYLIFWHYSKFVNIHKIINVIEPIYRIHSRTDNIEHNNRSLIELSSHFETILWDDYINNYNGYKRCMGTGRVSEKKSKKIVDLLILIELLILEFQ